MKQPDKKTKKEALEWFYSRELVHKETCGVSKYFNGVPMNEMPCDCYEEALIELGITLTLEENRNEL